MRRRLRRLLLYGLIAALVAAPVLFVLRARPQLDDARDSVDTRWEALRAELVDRYDTLDSATGAASDAGLDDALIGELRAALDDWSRSDDGGDAAVGVVIANTLEGLGARLAAVRTGNARFEADEALAFTMAAYTENAPDPDLVSAYSDAVDHYESERSSALKKPLSGVFGFKGRDDFEPSIRTT